MRVRRLVPIVTAMMGGLAALAVPASAQTLGQAVSSAFYYPNMVTQYENDGSSTVGGTPLLSSSSAGSLVSQFTNHSLTITTTQASATFIAVAFNGPAYFSGDFNFNTASINIASTFVVDPSRLITSGGALYVNLQGLTIQSGQALVLDINGPSTVPEPGSIALLGTGLAGLIPIVRRRKRV